MSKDLNPQDLAKQFQITHGQSTATPSPDHQQEVEVCLSPTRRGEDTSVFPIGESDWNMAIRLATFAGFGGAGSDGLTREAVLWFRRALVKGEVDITKGAKTPTANPGSCPYRYFAKVERRKRLNALIAFLAGDGRNGVGLERRWRRAM